MAYNKYFQDLLPKLSKEETIMYFERYKNGDKDARDVLISRNIGFVLCIVNSITAKGVFSCDVNDLISTGIIGLIKAIDTFDINKNILFTTYANICIRNEINMFFRNTIKHQKVFSLESIMTSDKDNFETLYMREEQLTTEKKYIEKEIMEQLKVIISTLSEKDQKILNMYFGLNNSKMFNQEEIAKEFNVSQSYLSRKIKKILELLKTICLMNGLIEYNSKLFEEKTKCKVKA